MLHSYEEPAIPYQPEQYPAQVAPQNDPAPSRPGEVQTSYTGNSFDVSPNASQFPTPRRRVGGLRTGAIIALTLRDIVPVWLAVAIPARDVLLAFTLPVLRRHGYGPLPVHFLGKAATMCLLYAFPLLLLADHSGAVGDVAKPFAWAFTVWGVGLYWWAGWLYVVQPHSAVPD